MCYEITRYTEGISKVATVLSALMKVYTVPCHDRGYINIVLGLQSSSDSLHIVPSSSNDTNAASSDCAYHVVNVKVEEDLDMLVKEEEEELNVKTETGIASEEEELNVKTEEGIASEEEEFIGIKDEKGTNSEEEEEVKDIHIKLEEDVGIKEEVSLQGTV